MERTEHGFTALIGLGAIGIPLAHLLSKRLGDRFFVLADEQHAARLSAAPLVVNGEPLTPRIVSCSAQLPGPITVLFICVKNYSLEDTLPLLRDCVTDQTVILPLQNGVFSQKFFVKQFPNNVILEGFAQGPNTVRTGGSCSYEQPGTYHVGSSEPQWKPKAGEVYKLLSSAKIPCYLDDDIRHMVWKKYMLNVAGNAMTALTQIDYNMFSASKTAQSVCRTVMAEFRQVAALENVIITEEDVEQTIQYFVNYPASKHTSMLEDVLCRRRTENDFIAGHIVALAHRGGVPVPATEMLYQLMKIREDVYLGRLQPGRK